MLLGVALMVAMASPKPEERSDPPPKAAPHETVQAPPARVAPVAPAQPPQRTAPVERIEPITPVTRVQPVPHVQPVPPVRPVTVPTQGPSTTTQRVMPPDPPHRIPVPPSPRRTPIPAPTPVATPTPAPAVVNNYNNYGDYDDDRYRGYYQNYGYDGYYNGFGAYGTWNSWDAFYAWYPTLVYYGYLPQGYQLADATIGARLLQAYKLQETQCNQSGLVVMWWPDHTASCAYPNTLVGPGDYTIDTTYLTLTSIR